MEFPSVHLGTFVPVEHVAFAASADKGLDALVA